MSKKGCLPPASSRTSGSPRSSGSSHPRISLPSQTRSPNQIGSQEVLFAPSGTTSVVPTLLDVVRSEQSVLEKDKHRKTYKQQLTRQYVVNQLGVPTFQMAQKAKSSEAAKKTASNPVVKTSSTSVRKIVTKAFTAAVPQTAEKRCTQNAAKPPAKPPATAAATPGKKTATNATQSGVSVSGTSQSGASILVKQNQEFNLKSSFKQMLEMQTKMREEMLEMQTQMLKRQKQMVERQKQLHNQILDQLGQIFQKLEITK